MSLRSHRSGLVMHKGIQSYEWGDSFSPTPCTALHPPYLIFGTSLFFLRDDGLDEPGNPGREHVCVVHIVGPCWRLTRPPATLIKIIHLLAGYFMYVRASPTVLTPSLTGRVLAANT